MKLINRVTKNKQRLLFLLSSPFDFDKEKVKKLIPRHYKGLEITIKPAKENRGMYTCVVDYITSLDVEKREKVEEETKDGKREPREKHRYHRRD